MAETIEATKEGKLVKGFVVGQETARYDYNALANKPIEEGTITGEFKVSDGQNNTIIIDGTKVSFGEGLSMQKFSKTGEALALAINEHYILHSGNYQNYVANGITDEEKQLIYNLLSNITYKTDMSQTLLALATLWNITALNNATLDAMKLG